MDDLKVRKFRKNDGVSRESDRDLRTKLHELQPLQMQLTFLAFTQFFSNQVTYSFFVTPGYRVPTTPGLLPRLSVQRAKEEKKEE